MQNIHEGLNSRRLTSMNSVTFSKIQNRTCGMWFGVHWWARADWNDLVVSYRVPKCKSKSTNRLEIRSLYRVCYPPLQNMAPW